MTHPIVKPGATIGILGGGQLGRMMALAGRAMSYRFVTLDPTPDSPCGQVADQQIIAPFDDVQAATRLAAMSDVITYEFENVDAQITKALEQQSSVPQGSELLRMTQNRITEKEAVQSHDIPVAPFHIIHQKHDVQQFIERNGLPAVMKTATGGYDGKGQWVLRSQDDLNDAYQSLSQSQSDLIVESFIPFEKELSVIVVRNGSGDVTTFPVAENVHVDNILHMSIVPARIREPIQKQAKQLAEHLAKKLNLVGLLAVEMFLTKGGDLYVNELAPRPHNSGHYTMDACMTSQFEQHVRAICHLPLGPTKLLTPVVMVNLLGKHLNPILDQVDRLPGHIKLHVYGKRENKPQRKMGHLNVLADSVQHALEIVNKLGIWD